MNFTWKVVLTAVSAQQEGRPLLTTEDGRRCRSYIHPEGPKPNSEHSVREGQDTTEVLCSFTYTAGLFPTMIINRPPYSPCLALEKGPHLTGTAQTHLKKWGRVQKGLPFFPPRVEETDSQRTT